MVTVIYALVAIKPLMLSIVMPSAAMLGVVMLSVVAPLKLPVRGP
jgi:hypothetical protein